MGKYSKWITIKKMVYQGIFVFISGGVTALINFVEALPPDQSAWIFGIVLILLKAIENYAKHHNDE